MEHQPDSNAPMLPAVIGDENTVNASIGLPPRAPSKEDVTPASVPIPWKNPAVRKIFIGLVFRNKAYMVTTDITQKYNVIAYKLMNNYRDFKKYGLIKGSSLRKQYERYRDAFIKKLALEKEGSNFQMFLLCNA